MVTLHYGSRAMSDLPDLSVDLNELRPHDAERMLELVAADIFIQYASQILLGRLPTPTELEVALGLAARLDWRCRIVARMLRSSEFARRSRSRWSASLEVFIHQAYIDVLGRLPDDSGMKTYMRIGSKWQGRCRVLRALVLSPEGRQNQGGKLERVEGLKRLASRSRSSLPLLACQFLNRWRQRELRLQKMEVVLASLISDPAEHDQTTLLGQIREQLPKLGWDYDDAGHATIKAEKTAETDIDSWVFEQALLNARRVIQRPTGQKR